MAFHIRTGDHHGDIEKEGDIVIEKGAQVYGTVTSLHGDIRSEGRVSGGTLVSHEGNIEVIGIADGRLEAPKGEVRYNSRDAVIKAHIVDSNKHAPAASGHDPFYIIGAWTNESYEKKGDIIIIDSKIDGLGKKVTSLQGDIIIAEGCRHIDSFTKLVTPKGRVISCGGQRANGRWYPAEPAAAQRVPQATSPSAVYKPSGAPDGAADAQEPQRDDARQTFIINTGVVQAGSGPVTVTDHVTLGSADRTDRFGKQFSDVTQHFESAVVLDSVDPRTAIIGNKIVDGKRVPTERPPGSKP
jgi:hypothetical protein